MDNDSFSPAFITAARVIGLGSYAVKLLETSGVVLQEEGNTGPVNSIGWRGFPEEVGLVERIKGILSSEILEPSHTVINFSTLLLESLRTGGILSKLEVASSTNNAAVGKENLAKEKSLIKATIGTAVATILDGLGRSNFLQIAPAQKTRVHWGIVNAAGGRVLGSEGWTSVKEGGAYAVRFFAVPFNTSPTVIGVDAQGTHRTFSYANLGGAEAVNGFNCVLTFGAGAEENIQFAFIAIG